MRKRGARQSRPAAQPHAAVGVQLHLHLAQLVMSRSAAGRHHRVGDQERTLQSFGAQRDLQERPGQMDSIDDEAGRQTILGELLPNVIRMAGQHRVRAIAEVRGERRARADRGCDLAGRCPGVADADHHALLDHGLDEARRLRPLGRQRNQANVSARGVLEAMELVEIRRPHPCAPDVRRADRLPAKCKDLPRERLPSRSPPEAPPWRPARLRSAPNMSSGDPVITVGKKRVTPVGTSRGSIAAISSWLADPEL